MRIHPLLGYTAIYLEDNNLFKKKKVENTSSSWASITK